MHFDEYSNKLFGGGPTFTRNLPESEQEPADQKEFGVRVEIDEDVYRKVMHWIDKAPGEVSGLGKVVYNEEENVLHVVDAILLPQKNSGVSTEIDGQDIAKAMFLTKDSPGTLRWWWHSHVDMDVFWSGTDVATIKQLGGGGWFLSTVLNKKREMKSAYCQVAPVRMIVDDLETDIMEYITEEEEKEWDEEYAKNCKEIPDSELFFGNYSRYSQHSKENKEESIAEQYRKLFDGDLTPEECDNFPRYSQEDDDVDIERLKAEGFEFDDDDADEDKKMDFVPKKKRK